MIIAFFILFVKIKTRLYFSVVFYNYNFARRPARDYFVRLLRNIAPYVRYAHAPCSYNGKLHKTLHISKYYGRSANGEILYLIRQAIKEFETREGQIRIATDKEVLAIARVLDVDISELFEYKI